MVYTELSINIKQPFGSKKIKQPFGSKKNQTTIFQIGSIAITLLPYISSIKKKTSWTTTIH
jgi:hypothetical protein